MGKHAIWVLRLWLAGETAACWWTHRDPHPVLASQLFGLVSLIGAALLIRWFWHHAPGLQWRLCARARAHPLGALVLAGWVSALATFGPLSQAGLPIAGKALVIAVFAITCAWMIQHHPRLVLAAAGGALLMQYLSGRRRIL